MASLSPMLSHPALPKNDGSWIGSMDGTGMILGDVLSPVSDERDWEAARD
jgi:hypothetical protein